MSEEKKKRRPKNAFFKKIDQCFRNPWGLPDKASIECTDDGRLILTHPDGFTEHEMKRQLEFHDVIVKATFTP